MNDLIIVCAGSMGREVLQIVKDINKVSPTWNILGFLSDVSDTLDDYSYHEKIIGTIKDWNVKPNQYFALAISDCAGKKKIVESLSARGANFATIIHPSAWLSDTTKIGTGCIIYWNLDLGPDTIIGDYCTIMATVGHDSSIGDFSTVCGNTSVNGHVSIGRETFVGSNVAIVPKTKIGNNVYVGLGSVVIKNVKDGKHVFGNPAKVVDL